MAIVINGSGEISGISVGGLPDGIVDAGTLATNSVDSAELIDGSIDNSHIDAMAASKLTGALPAISGAALTGLSSFDPDGAVVINESGADVDFRVESDTKVNAFTVNGATGRVGVNRGTDPDARLEVSAGSETAFAVTATVSGEYGVIVTSGSTNATPIIDLRNTDNTSRLKVLADGRGVSKFTAHSWCRFRTNTNTPSIRASHNVSSVTDLGTGATGITFTNDAADADYVIANSKITQYSSAGSDINTTGTTTSYYTMSYVENNIARDGEFRTLTMGNQ